MRIRDHKKNLIYTDKIDRSLKSLDGASKDINLSKEIVTRSQSADFISTVLGALPNPDPVLKNLGIDIEVYEDLRYDSRVKAVVRTRKSAVKALEWTVTGEDVPEEEVEFHKAWIHNVGSTRLSENTSGLKDIIVEICDGYLFGYKPLEVLWASDGVRQYPGKLIGKPQRWFGFDDNNQLRFYSKDSYSSGIELPKYRFVIAQNESSYDNPYGVADLSACYWPVVFRRNGFKFWTNFLEKYGIPFLLGKGPEGTQEDKLTSMANTLADMVQDATAAIPKDWDVDILESKSNSGGAQTNQHKIYLDVMNMEIAMAILGTNLTVEVSGGSYAAANTHLQVRDDIVESDQEIVESVFNQLIRWTHDFNFTTRNYPVFHLSSEEKVDETRSKRDKNLLESNPGLKFTKEYYMRKYNLAEDEIELTENTGGNTNE